jgi:hypothetical protein
MGVFNTTDLGIRLVLWIGPMVPLPAPPWFSQALQRVEVTSDASSPGGFQLTFALSKDTPIDYTGLLAGTLTPYNRVVIGVLMGALPEILIDGVITHHQFTPSDKPGMTTVTATGQDLSAIMDLIELSLPYPNMPDAAIAALVLAKYAPFGVVPTVIPTADIPLITDRLPWQTSETDYAYLQRLAARNGYVFYVAPVTFGVNMAYFGPDVRFGIPQSALTANMGAASNVISMSFDYDAAKPVAAFGTMMTTQIPIPVPVPLPSIPLAYLPPLASIPTLPRHIKYLGDVAQATPAQALAALLGALSPGLDVVTCQGTLDAVRYGGVLKTRQPVGVRGVGFSYDGFYYVKRVTHTIQGGQYTQAFSLVREGLGAITPAVVP